MMTGNDDHMQFFVLMQFFVCFFDVRDGVTHVLVAGVHVHDAFSVTTYFFIVHLAQGAISDQKHKCE